jgi:hypothetical protein
VTRSGSSRSVLCLLGALWGVQASADVPKCPRAAGPWIDVIFSGPAWTPAQQESVVRELRIEVSRRALDACVHTDETPSSPPTAVVTLLCNDADRISIVPARMQDEGGFSGRTIHVGSIPEDARSLAIAQAVDEVLRGVPAAPELPPAPAPLPAREIIVREAPRAPPRSPFRLGVSVAPTLLIAPSGFTDASKTALAPAASLRVAVTSSRIGGSLGLVLGRATNLVFGSVSINQFRLPVDASLRLLARAGQLEGALDAGIVVALLREEYTPARRSFQDVEAGARAGLTVFWGDRIMPWLGAAIEVMPTSHDLRFAPMGTIGHTPNLWLGVAVGMEVRWP